MSNIILPTEDSQPIRNPKLLLIYGQRKAGKSTILPDLAKLGSYLILETDPNGADYIPCKKIDIKDYNHYMEVTDAIIKQGKPYKFLVLDTITTFEDMCEVDATERYKASNMGKNFKGKSVLELTSEGGFNPGYNWLRLSFSVAMQRLMQCAPYIILVGHIKDKFVKVEDKDKGKSDSQVSAKELDNTGKIRSMIVTAASAQGLLYRTSNTDGTQQTLRVSFKTGEHVNCGVRCPHLVQQEFPFDWSKIYVDPV